MTDSTLSYMGGCNHKYILKDVLGLVCNECGFVLYSEKELLEFYKPFIYNIRLQNYDKQIRDGLSKMMFNNGISMCIYELDNLIGEYEEKEDNGPLFNNTMRGFLQKIKKLKEDFNLLIKI